LKGKFQLEEIKQRYNEKTAPVTKNFFEIYDTFLAIKELSMTHNGHSRQVNVIKYQCVSDLMFWILNF
jgi:hypothetical protein